LDGVDGYVARRTRTVSELGARFDMEVDAFLILVLSVLVAASVGPWVLAIGAMRYVFVVAGWGMPWMRAPLPPSFARTTIAAVQGIGLVIAASGIVPRPIATVVTGAALLLLILSLARDIRWLWQHYRSPRSVS
jgi:phosphatidylglycerophosphate synthase